MKVTILVDNYVPNENESRAEPSFSCYIEDGDSKILFDLGMTKLPYENAKRLNIDLSNIDFIILSHGHLDHTWGLKYLLKQYIPKSTTKLICHPDALKKKKYEKYNIGIKHNEQFLRERFDLIATKTPYNLSKRIIFLGEIERSNDFENKKPLGKQKNGTRYEDDYVMDDSAIVYCGDDGIVIITGCSHSGICNIAEYAKKITGTNNIKAVIGGLHLQNTEANEISKRTMDYIEKQNIHSFYPCHCTNLYNKIEISKRTKVEEIGSGTIIEFGNI